MRIGLDSNLVQEFSVFGLPFGSSLEEVKKAYKNFNSPEHSR